MKTQMKNTRIIPDEKGVSPVIAILLMVGVTLALAAVIFYLLGGLIQPVPKEENVLTGSWDTEYGGRFLVLTFGPPTDTGASNLMVENMIYQIQPADFGTGSTRTTFTERLVDTYERDLDQDLDGDGKPDFHVKFQDNSVPKNGLIDAGDMIWIRTTSDDPPGPIQTGDSFRIDQDPELYGRGFVLFQSTVDFGI